MTTPTTLYGIANCDTLRKARRWLDDAGIEYTFHDYRRDGLDAELLDRLIDVFGWEAMLNRRGTTWRKLDEATRSGITAARARSLMLEAPSLIRRPLLLHGRQHLLGFDQATYEEVFT